MVDIDGLVIRDGMRVAASGHVITAGEEVWFQPNLPRRLPRYAPGRQPPLQPARGVAVRVDGVDASRLDQRRRQGDAVEGWARLTGVWNGARVAVDDQGPPDSSDVRPRPEWKTPPCSPPPGGWPSLTDAEASGDRNMDWPADFDGPEVVNRTTFRPSRLQLVAVVASTDPELTRSRLVPRLGDRLCVVHSRWTRQQVEQVRERLRLSDWPLLSHGETSDEVGQLIVDAKVRQVVPPFAAYARELPDGLLQVRSWLRPA